MKERNLIIDDEPWVHEVAHRYLEREGLHRPLGDVRARGPRAGGHQAAALLVLDLMLPNMSGDEISAAVRGRSDVAVLT